MRPGPAGQPNPASSTAAVVPPARSLSVSDTSSHTLVANRDCPFVAQAATWPLLPLRSATASEQQSPNVPLLPLTWPSVRDWRKREIASDCAACRVGRVRRLTSVARLVLSGSVAAALVLATSERLASGGRVELGRGALAGVVRAFRAFRDPARRPPHAAAWSKLERGDSRPRSRRASNGATGVVGSAQAPAAAARVRVNSSFTARHGPRSARRRALACAARHGDNGDVASRGARPERQRPAVGTLTWRGTAWRSRQ
jgi:hypothetical protein